MGTVGHHRLHLGLVEIGPACVAHDRGYICLRGKFLVARSRHLSSVGKQFTGVFLKLGVFDQSLVSAGPALLDTAECKDARAESDDAGNDRDDDDFVGFGETIPLLLDGLGGRLGIGPVELQRSGVAKCGLAHASIDRIVDHCREGLTPGPGCFDSCQICHHIYTVCRCERPKCGRT